MRPLESARNSTVSRESNDNRPSGIVLQWWGCCCDTEYSRKHEASVAAHFFFLKVTVRLSVPRVNYYEILFTGETIDEFCDDWNEGVT